MFSILGRNVGRGINYRGVQAVQSSSKSVNSVRQYSSNSSNSSNPSFQKMMDNFRSLNAYDKVIVGSGIGGTVIGTDLSMYISQKETNNIFKRIGYACGGAIGGGMMGLFFGFLSPIIIPVAVVQYVAIEVIHSFPNE